ncbi:MAG: TetR/AcrR family transcriptional regulator [Pseudomonadota bacterium]|nr:TetR/AcrR family transcriptional regulator [Pseudomonadota bacterium]
MGKGDTTRQAILEHATTLATTVGLDGLSIGQLATDLGLSKSGLFAHFQSKEGLQLAVVETASDRFTDLVVRPGLKAPRGEPRVRALMERWVAWVAATGTPGGCFFVAASTELDDRPGPLRDAVVQRQRDWIDLLANSVRAAIAEGHFREDTDPEQLAFELWGFALGFHHHARLLGAPNAASRAHAAIDRLLVSARRVA